ncbi:MAG: CatA-like O-acetyltransferase [bacterium]
MPKYLEIETWKRKAQYHFFKKYDQPFFNICAPVDITALYEISKAKALSFFLTSLYFSTHSANAIPEFRYRLRGDRVLIYDAIHPASTVLKKDDTFGFCYFEYTKSFSVFHENASRHLNDILEKSDALDPQEDRDDLIHYSVIPWLAFTSFSHARRFGMDDSVPKIVFGKYEKIKDKIKMPVSVEVHHALMDGLHVGRFFETLQDYLIEPEAILNL